MAAERDLQSIADKAFEQWLNTCGKFGEFLLQEVQSLRGHAELPEGVADELSGLCEANMHIGAFLSLFSLKVSYVSSDPGVAKELVDNYAAISAELSDEYLGDLKELAKALRSEHGLDELSSKVNELSKALDRLVPHIAKVQAILERSIPKSSK